MYIYVNNILTAVPAIKVKKKKIFKGNLQKKYPHSSYNEINTKPIQHLKRAQSIRNMI